MASEDRLRKKNAGQPTSGLFSPNYSVGSSGGGHPVGDTCLMALLMLPFTLAMAPFKLGRKLVRR